MTHRIIQTSANIRREYSVIMRSRKDKRHKKSRNQNEDFLFFFVYLLCSSCVCVCVHNYLYILYDLLCLPIDRYQNVNIHRQLVLQGSAWTFRSHLAGDKQKWLHNTKNQCYPKIHNLADCHLYIHEYIILVRLKTYIFGQMIMFCCLVAHSTFAFGYVRLDCFSFQSIRLIPVAVCVCVPCALNKNLATNQLKRWIILANNQKCVKQQGNSWGRSSFFFLFVFLIIPRIHTFVSSFTYHLIRILNPDTHILSAGTCSLYTSTYKCTDTLTRSHAQCELTFYAQHGRTIQHVPIMKWLRELVNVCACECVNAHLFSLRATFS